MTPQTPQLVIKNDSTQVDAKWCWNLAWVIDYQLRYQAAPLLKATAEVSALAAGAAIPAGAWVLHLLDEITDAPGALGYHDEGGDEVPFGRVGIKTALENNAQPSEVASHEALEMIGDPHINLTAVSSDGSRLYPVELCDPVQGFAYDLGAPYGQKTGWIVSDFVLNNWFDPNTKPRLKTDYRGGLHGPFTLGPQGYLSYAASLPPNWQQEYGEHADKSRVDADDRISRRGLTAY